MSEVKPSPSYYDVLGVRPGASVQEIRRAYRELSKLYHPDTTDLPWPIATEKFQTLNEAYATLSSPDRRASYDLRNGYSRMRVMGPDLLNNPSATPPTRRYRSSAYLDPSDRPLSAGELFALFILGLTFVACLLLVITLGITRGELALQALPEVPLPSAVRESLPPMPQPSPPPTDEPLPPVGLEPAQTPGAPPPASPLSPAEPT